MAKLVTDLGDGLDEKIDTAAQLAKAARDSAEVAIVPQQMNTLNGTSSLAHWEQLRSEWHDMRDRIELAIKRIKHASVRGKYAKFDRYSYRDIIVTLADDKEISRQAEAALILMNQRFMALKSRPSQTSAKDVADFTEWKKAVNGSLPKLPRARTSTVAPAVPEAAE